MASGSGGPGDDRDLFLQIVDEPDIIGWKRVSHLIENALGRWKENGKLDPILNYDEFDDEETREAMRLIGEAESSHADLVIL